MNSTNLILSQGFYKGVKKIVDVFEMDTILPFVVITEDLFYKN